MNGNAGVEEHHHDGRWPGYKDPGWYDNPAGTLALAASDDELRRDSIEAKGPQHGTAVEFSTLILGAVTGGSFSVGGTLLDFVRCDRHGGCRNALRQLRSWSPPFGDAEEELAARRHLLLIEKDSIVAAFHKGYLSHEVLDRLMEERI